MLTEKKLLKVGDVLYSTTSYGLNRYVIERVTKTQAMSKTDSFRREYTDDKNIYIFGFRSTSELETPELLALYKKSVLQNKVKRLWHETRCEDLTAAQCEAILDILKKS